jgi:large subunit ribosomal protein L25
MSEHILKAEKRQGSGKGLARKMRASGRVPGVVYGKDMDTIHVSLDAQEAEHLFRSISVENTIVDLDIKGVRGKQQTLVREIQTHPVRSDLLHVDFLRIQKGVAVDLEIPVNLTGVPVGVKLHGGVLEQIIHELPVRCIPSRIPESFEVDVAELDIDNALHVSDIEFGEGVEPTIDLDRTLCLVAAPRVHEEPVEEGILAEGLEEEAAEPEVIGEADGEGEKAETD